MMFFDVDSGSICLTVATINAKDTQTHLSSANFICFWCILIHHFSSVPPDDQYYLGLLHILSVIFGFVSVFFTTIMFNDVESGSKPKHNLSWLISLHFWPISIYHFSSFPPDDQYYFGLLHILSVILSFVSVFFTTIMFNDVESGSNSLALATTNAGGAQGSPSSAMTVGLNNSKGFLAKLCVAIPFFAFTLVFRAVSLALLICFLKFWGGTIIFWWEPSLTFNPQKSYLDNYSLLFVTWPQFLHICRHKSYSF